MSELNIPEDLRLDYEMARDPDKTNGIQIRSLIERIARLEAALTDDEAAAASQNDWETKRLSKGGFLRVISSRSSES